MVIIIELFRFLKGAKGIIPESLKSIKQLFHAKSKHVFGIDYRVASLFSRYISAKGIIPESLNSTRQF